MTYCFICLDSSALLMLNYWFDCTQTSQIAGQLYSDTSPYKVNSALEIILVLMKLPIEL